MKASSLPLLVSLFLSALPGMLAAQEKPRYDMGTMLMIFLSRSAHWSGDDHTRETLAKHRAYVEDLVNKGMIALHGEVTGDSALHEVMVFKIDSMVKVDDIVRAMPGVREGIFDVDRESWFAARNLITPPARPIAPRHYVLGLLVKGEVEGGDTTELKQVQAGHMANIERLAAMGKLVLAGPFHGRGHRRGIFIFKVDSIEEAQALTDTDPAVIAGRLKIELYDWTVPKGMLP